MASNLACDLTCPICLNYYTDPVLTRCGHNFCRSCLLRCAEMQLAAEDGELVEVEVEEGEWVRDGEQEEEESGESLIRCPQCRLAINLDEIYTNRQLARVIQGVRVLYTSNPAPRKTECKTHHEELKIFCRDDWQPICMICAFSQAHKLHTCVPIGEAEAEIKENLQQPLAIMEERLREYRAMQQSQGEKITTFLNMTEGLREQVGEDLRAMHCFLDEQQKQLMRRLAQEEQRVLMMLGKNVALITKESESIKSIINDIQPQLNTTDPHRLLQDYRGILQRYESVLPYYPVLNEPKSNLGEFTGPLQYTVWKKMLGIIKPVPALLKLDASTAHSRLVISEDGAEVRLSPGQQSVGESPARFSERRSVLGAQSFLSGRHYWEVEVGNSPVWSLGLAAESIPRVGSSLLCPKTGLWAVGLQWQEGYRALSSPPTLLTPPHRPKKLGVYLDYEGGQVSFYNADNMSHLHTFTQTFTEKLYPYLSTASKAQSLRLVTLPDM